MTKQKCSMLSAQTEDLSLGGRGLTSKYLHKKSNFNCDPIGPENILIIAPGLLTGSKAPSSGNVTHFLQTFSPAAWSHTLQSSHQRCRWRSNSAA